MADCRAALADLLGADPAGIVFGRSMTDLTYDMSRALARTWQAGDEVVVTRLDHDANVRPWIQAAEAAGAVVRWVDFDPATGELRPRAPGCRDVRADAAGGPHRGVQRARHPAGRPGAGRVGPRGRRAALRRRRPPRGPPAPRRGRARRRLLRVLAVQVRRAPLRGRGSRAGPAGGAAPRQAAPRHRSGTGAVRAGHAPLRADGRDHGCRRLPRLARSRPGRPPGARASPVPTPPSRPTSPSSGAGSRRPWPPAATRRSGHAPPRARRPSSSPSTACAPTDAHAALGERHVSISSGHCYAWEPCHRLGLGATGAIRVGLAPYNDDDDVDRLLEGLADLGRG